LTTTTLCLYTSIATGASNTEALILLRVVPVLGTAIQHDTCSRSRRRAAKADKRMVLVHTHGLFIT
jgi:hypothetical protein